MRHSQRTSPAVVALLLALGVDAYPAGTLYVKDAPNSMPFPDVGMTGATAAQGDTWGSSDTEGNNMYENIKWTATTTDSIDYATYAAAKTFVATSTTEIDQHQASCVDCIRSNQVWCSRFYVAEKASGVYTVAVTNVGATNTFTVNASPSATAASMVDLGSCCWMNGKTANNETRNKALCPARYTNVGGATIASGGTSGGSDVGKGTLGTTYTYPASTVYWCSDGAYQLSSGTEVTQVAVNTPLTANMASAAYTTKNDYLVDPRTEWWLISCRQRQDICGKANIMATGTTYTDTAVNGVRAISHASGAIFSHYEKCTYIMNAYGKGAPTFKVEAGSGKTFQAGYDLHYVEYSSEYSAAATTWATVLNMPSMQGTAAANTGVFLPSTGSYAELKGRLYDTARYAGFIEQPLVWSWVDAAAATTAKNYQKKRWFPVSIAEDEIADYKLKATAFTNAVTAYNGLKTTYNAALVPVESDFFADMFNPPDEVVVPLRPAKPTDLAAYNGKRMASKAATSTYTFDKALSSANIAAQLQIALTPVTANDFVVDGGMGGGWGSFTMGMIDYATATTGVAKSFGVFGASTDLVAGLTMSQSQKAIHMCAAADVQTTGFCKSTGAGDSLSYNILLVSVWANDSKASDFSATKGMTLTFSVSAWKDHSGDWAAPATPGYATAPDMPAGAKALAASVAAAAAVAAALY